MSKKVFKKVTIAIKGSISVINNLPKKILQSNLAFFSHGKLLLIKKKCKISIYKKSQSTIQKSYNKKFVPRCYKT